MSTKIPDGIMDEYFSLCHAMQSGVKQQMEIGGTDTEPKHLRVGINTAMSDHGALVKLLVDKGVISDAEYVTYLRDFMRMEVDRYEKLLSEHYGVTIRLG